MDEPERKPKPRGRPKRAPVAALPAERPADTSDLPPEPEVEHNFAQLAMDSRSLGMIGQALIKLPGMFQAAADMQASILYMQMSLSQMHHEQKQLAEELQSLRHEREGLKSEIDTEKSLLTEAHTAEIDRQLREYRESAEREMQVLAGTLEDARHVHQQEMEQIAERRQALEGEIAQIEQIVKQHQTGLGSLMQSVQAISVEGS